MRLCPRFATLLTTVLFGCLPLAFGQKNHGRNSAKAVDDTPAIGTIITYAGLGPNDDTYTGDGGPADEATLDEPYAVATDQAGNVYIVDARNCVIRKVDHSTGIISTYAGNGTPGYSGDGGPATQAMLYSPRGAAVDPDGNLYIADTFNYVIRKVDHITGTISTVVGSPTDCSGGVCQPGIAGYSGDGGAASKAELNKPMGLAFDTGGNLYITDYQNSAIRKVTISNETINTVAGVPPGGTAGCENQTDEIGDGCLAPNGTLFKPEAVAISPSGDLYIADSTNLAVRKVDKSSGIISVYAGLGYGCIQQTDNTSDGCPAVDAQDLDAMGIAFDAAGNLYV
jgi:streptogramin lyase